jgi:hypothetical protein
MKKLIMTLTLAFCVITFVKAYDYNTGIGLRAGPYYGLTIKHFIGSKSALEGLLTRMSGTDITVLYEIHNRAFDVNRLNWYYGLGGHIGFWEGSHLNNGTAGNHYTIIGLDGIIGLEYNISEAPINISVDWKPAFNIIGYSEFWPLGGAFSIRYIF